MIMVHSEKGGYSDKAMALGYEVNNAIKDIVIKYYEEGLTIEAICYIVQEEAKLTLIQKRIKNMVKG